MMLLAAPLPAVPCARDRAPPVSGMHPYHNPFCGKAAQFPAFCERMVVFMFNRSAVISIVLLIISLLLGIGAAVLLVLGRLNGFVTAQPFFFAFGLFALALIALLLAFCIQNQGNNERSRGSPCRCVFNYSVALIISALLLIAASVLTVALTLTTTLAAILAFVVVTFFFFTLFLLAATLLCMVDRVQDRCYDCEE